MCGEHFGCSKSQWMISGSSPRVRGTLLLVVIAQNRVGIIPACAGNTSTTRRPAFIEWDHPRVCGEHGLKRWAKSGAQGIIPACAGNTRAHARARQQLRDHPRVCGEHQPRTPVVQCSAGSSPRVRGTLVPNGGYIDNAGIIPACAGNTRPGTFGRRWAWDHPRVCGEHCPSLPLDRPWTGSSPRVRGTQRGRRAWRPRAGIIPACAGNTYLLPFRAIVGRDHPRVCGEHNRNSGFVRSQAGSSPRVRGTLRVRAAGAHVVGIIPACAGNTSASQRSMASIRDHPRVCGEHAKFVKVADLIQGSSPRVRGTPVHLGLQHRQSGIIPACAGNTLRGYFYSLKDRDHPRVCGEHWY